MTLPTATNLDTLDYALGGQPFAGATAPNSNITIAITGNAATGAVGNLGASDTVSGSADSIGNAATGAVGTLAPSVSIPITGNAATGAVGNVGASDSVSGSADSIGNAATGAVGSLGANVTIAITGNAATGAVGTLAPSQTANPSQSLDGAGGRGRPRKTIIEDRRPKKAPQQIVEASGETEDITQHASSGDVSVILVIKIDGDSSHGTLEKSEGSIQSIMQIRGNTYGEVLNKSDASMDMVDVELHNFLLMLEDV